MQIKEKSHAGVSSWCSTRAPAGRNLVDNFGVVQLETKLMIILPVLRQVMMTIYIFNHITRKNRSFFTYMYTVFYTYLQRYKDTIVTALC